MTSPLTWDEVTAVAGRGLGEQVTGGPPLTPGWSSRTTWAARGARSGPMVVKARCGERSHEKTTWCAARLPLLGARGYPVPSIILTDGEKITGVVDWDEFALGSRALDLTVLALDCQDRGATAAAARLLARAAEVAGDDGLRCLVSYRALATLAENTREGQSPRADIQAISAVLDRLPAPGR